MYRIPSVKIQLVKDGTINAAERPYISTPYDVAAIMQPVVELLAEERMYVMLLSTKNRVNAIQEVSVGSLNASIVHPREIFKAAILSNAAALIMVHNHPSGDPTPSPEDAQITKLIVDAGKLLNIPILDHVVIGDRRYASMKEKGMI